MWENILWLFIGAAIPLLIKRYDIKEKEKYFKLEVKEKLKLIDVDKRRDAHQKAFRFWFDLLHSIHKPEDDKEKKETINNTIEFWQCNALYLENKTRKDFREAISIVSFYGMKLQMAKDENDLKKKEEYKNDYMKDWNFFMELPETIQKEVSLFPIRPDIDIDAEGNKKQKFP